MNEQGRPDDRGGPTYSHPAVVRVTDESPFRRVVDALERSGLRVREPYGGQVSAQCPAHDDNKPSLSVTEDDETGKVLVKCHAGCETADVVKAIGLTFDDLSLDTPSNGEIVHLGPIEPTEITYDYTDENGARLFQVVRTMPEKRFRQRRPNGDGWIWRLGDVRRVLYRLPELIADVQSGQTVYVVEGEKDVDRLRAIGLTATCNPMGAEKWREEYSPFFDGAEVVVIADRDKPGRKHARDVADSLELHAKSIRIVQAAVGKDVSDHLDAGLELDELTPVTYDDSWPVLSDAAYQGLVGETVRALAPTTEAADVALLVTFLAAAGALIGSKPHAWAGDDSHPGRVWPLLVGNTASGRKGSSWSAVRRVIGLAESDFLSSKYEAGLSSGEGLIEAVRDAVGEPDEKTYDAGVSDKRLLVVESEFASVLARAKREGSVLSQTLRTAWDSGNLRVLNRKMNSLRASDAHIVLIGHITPDELRLRLAEIEVGNGFINRFLPVLVKRSKRLPSGGGAPDEVVRALADRLKDVVKTAKEVGRISRTPAAEALWCDHVYAELTPDDPKGLAARAIARAVPQVIRLSVLYALLDGRREVDVEHLRAAWAVWRYVRRSAEIVFEDLSGNSDLDKLTAVIDQKGEITRSEASNLFDRHRTAAQLDALFAALLATGDYLQDSTATAGRSRQVYRRRGEAEAEEVQPGTDVYRVANAKEAKEGRAETEELQSSSDPGAVVLRPALLSLPSRSQTYAEPEPPATASPTTEEMTNHVVAVIRDADGEPLTDRQIAAKANVTSGGVDRLLRPYIESGTIIRDGGFGSSRTYAWASEKAGQ